MKYITAREAADKWGLNLRTVQYFCSRNKITGAKKLGRQWLLPSDTCLPEDRRKKSSVSHDYSERYLFPILIYTSAAYDENYLLESEKVLLHAQKKYLQGNRPEGIRICKELLSCPLPQHVRFGAYITIAHCWIPLGNYYEYLNALSCAENIMAKEYAHPEDYRLAINHLKFHFETDPDYMLSVDVRGLSSEALPFYQLVHMICSAMSDGAETEVMRHILDSICRGVHEEGIAALEVSMNFVAAMIYLKSKDIERARCHVIKACDLGVSRGWLGLLSKYCMYGSMLSRDYLSRSYPKVLAEVDAQYVKNSSGWQTISHIHTGSKPFCALGPGYTSIVLMIHLGLSNRQICSINGMSPYELKKTIVSICSKLHLSGKKELKNYLNAIFTD